MIHRASLGIGADGAVTAALHPAPLWRRYTAGELRGKTCSEKSRGSELPTYPKSTFVEARIGIFLHIAQATTYGGKSLSACSLH